jgi:bacillopeptidase F
VSAVLPVRLTDPAVVRFDEPVTGVTPSNVALRLASGAAVPATATCRNGTTPAACDAVVTQVELRPVAPLRPGEHYAVTVDGTPPRDAAGNAAIPATFGFRASTVEDQGSAAAAYAWRTVSDAAALGGSYAVERRAGARVTYAFTGTSVTWYGAAGPDQGRVQVLVDGADRGTVDTYAATRRWRVARTVGGLSPGAHTLTLRVAGTRSARSTGTNVVVDEVRAPTVGAPAWSWSGAAGSALSGGSAVIGDLAGARVTFTFRGTGVDWVTSLTPDAGRAAVYVDGRLLATYDNYSATRRHGVRRAVAGLPDGVHRVTVRVLGTRSSRSSGTLVAVDGWLVR